MGRDHRRDAATMSSSTIRVRRAIEDDIPALLTLMRQLAEFEG